MTQRGNTFLADKLMNNARMEDNLEQALRGSDGGL